MFEKCRRQILVLVLATVSAPLCGQVATPPAGTEEDSIAGGSYGLGNQDHFVAAFAFQSQLSTDSWDNFGPGYYRTASEGTWFAPLTLPAGAKITLITCYFYDNTPAHEATVTLNRYDYNTQTDSATVVSFLPQIVSTDAGGNHRVFESYAETVRYRPGLFSRQYYALRVDMPSSLDVRFRGCNVTWNRQVSPAPASATFTDVPVSHPYHQFIEALVDSGITAGCGGGNYCVDSPITRGEMAVFLSVALGLHFPY